VKILREFDVENQDLKTLFADPGWNGEAPLWFYILKEAELVGDVSIPEARQGRTLGLSAAIVAEVLVALCRRTPLLPVLATQLEAQLPNARVKGTCTMADLLMYAGVWSLNKRGARACERQARHARVDRSEITPDGIVRRIMGPFWPWRQY
jgi:hypothetical protein